MGIEWGCFEDVLQGVVTIRGNGFVAREGGLKGRRTVMILSRGGLPEGRRGHGDLRSTGISPAA